MAPSISSAAGTATTGSNITISGSSFGTKLHSTPLFFADFQDGSLAPKSGLSSITSFTDTDNYSLVTDNTNKRWGNGKVAKAAWSRNGTGGGRSAVLSVEASSYVSNGSKIYCSAWRRYNNGDTTGNWKWWRFWSSSFTFPDSYIGDSDIADTANRGWFHENSTPITHTNRVFMAYTIPNTTWRMDELMVKYNTSGGTTNGELWIFQGNSELCHETAFAFDGASVPGHPAYIFLQDTKANSDPGLTMESYSQDVVIDDTWSRVMIGNASTYSSCTHVEYQPFSSWSNTSVTINVRLGSFSSTTGLYLFVLDNSNVASTGYSLASLGGTAAPTVTSVSPSAGALAGGTAITITGTDFSATINSVTINGQACTSVVRVSATSITAVTPANAAGTYSLIVTNSDTQTGTLSSAYTYEAAPTITSVSPLQGALAGGTSITVTGTGFTSSVTSLTIGGTACTSVVRVSATSITALTPAKTAGTYDVVVTNSDTQTGTLASGFTYTSAPTINGITPGLSPLIGRSFTIAGDNFTTTVTVAVGGTACTSVNRLSVNIIVCNSPAKAAGTYDVVVTNSDGQTGTLSSALTYQPAPTITSISPSSGDVAGGTAITVTGTGFTVGTIGLTIANLSCTSVVRVSSTSITAVTPACSGGTFNVEVTNNDGQNAVLTNGYTYTITPSPGDPGVTLSLVDPSFGNAAEQTTITITGGNFVSGATVKVGGTSCTNVSVVSGTTITAKVPAKQIGIYDVLVTNPNASSGTLVGGYEYKDPIANSYRQLRFRKFFPRFY
jgi:hypothetical protein